VHFDERAHEREAKPRAAAIAALEAIERARLLIERHARACVRYGQAHDAIEAFG
jgi:hypothetical protein